MLNFRYGPDGSRARDRLVRQEPVPQHQSRPASEDAGADLQDQPRERPVASAWISRTAVRAARRAAAQSQRLVRAARAPASCRSAGPTRPCTRGSSGCCASSPTSTRKLRAIWALHVTGGLTEQDLLALLVAESEYVRSWAIYFLSQGRKPSTDGARAIRAPRARGLVAARAPVSGERAAARAGRRRRGSAGT